MEDVHVAFFFCLFVRAPFVFLSRASYLVPRNAEGMVILPRFRRERALSFYFEVLFYFRSDINCFFCTVFNLCKSMLDQSHENKNKQKR